MTAEPRTAVVIRESSQELLARLAPFGIRGNVLFCNLVEAEGSFVLVEVALKKTPEQEGFLFLPHGDILCIYSDYKDKRFGFALEAGAFPCGQSRAVDRASDHP